MINIFYCSFNILTVVDFLVDNYMLWNIQNTPDRTVIYKKKTIRGACPRTPIVRV